MTDECIPARAGAGTCIRGTVGCPVEHAPSLLEQLDQAERQVRSIQTLLTAALLGRTHQTTVDAYRADLNAASALCMAAAARCLVSIERTG